MADSSTPNHTYELESQAVVNVGVNGKGPDTPRCLELLPAAHSAIVDIKKADFTDVTVEKGDAHFHALSSMPYINPTEPSAWNSEGGEQTILPSVSSPTQGATEMETNAQLSMTLRNAGKNLSHKKHPTSRP